MFKGLAMFFVVVAALLFFFGGIVINAVTHMGILTSEVIAILSAAMIVGFVKTMSRAAGDD